MVEVMRQDVYQLGSAATFLIWRYYLLNCWDLVRSSGKKLTSAVGDGGGIIGVAVLFVFWLKHDYCKLPPQRLIIIDDDR